MSEIMNQVHVRCCLSTPEHNRRFNRSFIGWFISIFTDRGELVLTTDRVRFTGKSGIPIEIPVVAIKDIQVGHYSRWAMPFRLDYIEVRYQDGERERTVLLTPAPLWTSIGEMNRIVSKWAELLRDAQTKHA